MTTSTKPRPQPEAPPRARLQLSATQLVASALAAITATVAASYLGVSGTVIGAAVASVVTVTGNAVYGHSLRRTGARVREVVPLPERWSAPSGRPGAPTAVIDRVASRSDPEHAEDAEDAITAPVRAGIAWRRVGLAVVVVFVGILAAVTTVEVAAGRPLTDLLHDRSAAGTSLGETLTGGSTVTPNTPQVTVTVTPKVVVTTPTVVSTAPPVTTTVTPTVTTTAPSPTPSSSASSSAAASSSAPASTPATDSPSP